MLVFAGVCPHPPLLVPSIGKENIDQLQKTAEAMKKLEQELYASKPEIIIIISPHGEIMPETFVINFAKNYQADFEDFGDWQTKMEFKNSPELVSKIKEELETDFPVILTANSRLDYGTSVPLFYLSKHLLKPEIIPLTYSLLSYKIHWQLGKALEKIISRSDKRIAVIASGDLSHSLSKGAPAGYKPEGEEFDQKLIELIDQQNYQEILKLDQDLIENAAECGLRSFLILLGIINKYNHQSEILSYEGPLGVGYLVVNFKLK